MNKKEQALKLIELLNTFVKTKDSFFEYKNDVHDWQRGRFFPNMDSDLTNWRITVPPKPIEVYALVDKYNDIYKISKNNPIEMDNTLVDDVFRVVKLVEKL